MEVSVQNRRDWRSKSKQFRNGLEWRDEGIQDDSKISVGCIDRWICIIINNNCIANLTDQLLMGRLTSFCIYWFI